MTDTTDSKRDFFISFNQADRAWATWIAWVLEEAGYSVLFQDWDFSPGSSFVLEMQRAVTLAKRTVLVLSPNFLASRFTQSEWAAAFADDPTGEQGRVVPVRVAECDPRGLLGPIVYIDLVGWEEEAKAKDELLRGVRRDRAKPPVLPVFPSAAARQVHGTPRFPEGAVSIQHTGGVIDSKPINSDRRTGYMSYIFISYSHQDRDFAELLRWRLEIQGFRAPNKTGSERRKPSADRRRPGVLLGALNVWTDDKELIPGEDWRDSIDQAINNASALIVIMSPYAKKSEYVTYEWSFAWGRM